MKLPARISEQGNHYDVAHFAVVKETEVGSFFSRDWISPDNFLIHVMSFSSQQKEAGP